MVLVSLITITFSKLNVLNHSIQTVTVAYVSTVKVHLTVDFIPSHIAHSYCADVKTILTISIPPFSRLVQLKDLTLEQTSLLTE